VIARECSVLPPERAAGTRPLKPSSRLSLVSQACKVLSAQKRRECVDTWICVWLCCCCLYAGFCGAKVSLPNNSLKMRVSWGEWNRVVTSHFCERVLAWCPSDTCIWRIGLNMFARVAVVNICLNFSRMENKI